MVFVNSVLGGSVPTSKTPTGTTQTFNPNSLSGPGAYTTPNPLVNNPYGAPDFLAQFQPQWNIPTPYDPLLAQAKTMLQTPQQGRTIAGQQVGAQISAALGGINASSTAQQQALAAMQQRSAGLAAALGSFGPQYAQTMSGIYNQAANTMGALGPGVTGQGQADMSNALQAAQAQVAAKTGGQGQVTTYDPSAITGTLNTTGVQMPGNALAMQGVGAAQLGYWGAQADKAQAQTITDYYAQQATQALQQTAAERAQVVAQRPELFQQALEAQKQDQLAYQQNYDSLMGQATDYIMNRNQFRLNQLQSVSTWWTEQAGLTHINPLTQQPLAGYGWVPGSNHTLVASIKDIQTGQYQKTMGTAAMIRANAFAGHQQDWMDIWTRKNDIASQNAQTKAFLATQPGKYNAGLSAQMGHAVDASGNSILGPDGKPVPYTAPKKAPTPMTANEKVNLVGAMGTGVEQWANGIPATAKAAAVPAITMSNAIQQLQAKGWFSTPWQANAAITALSSAYSHALGQTVTPQDVMTVMATGQDMFGPGTTNSYVGLHPGAAPAQAQPPSTYIPPSAGRGAGSIAKNIQRAGGVPTARGTR